LLSRRRSSASYVVARLSTCAGGWGADRWCGQLGRYRDCLRADSPSWLERLKPSCSSSGHTIPDPNPLFTAEVSCDSMVSLFGLPGGVTCLPGSNYPRQTQVVMQPLPANLPTMPDPCAGVPANPWCAEP
jgi:hypothetical protein